MDYQERHFLEGMNEGEIQLYNKCLWLEDDDFRLIPNAMLQRMDEGTNQIDLLAVTKKGIFVIEMKDYKGWIFGDENHKMWTQTLQAGSSSRKYQLRNPVKQNENHIKTVRSLLAGKGINDLPIYNVIVFGNEAVLKEISTSVDVVNLSEVISVFGKYRDLVISREEIKAVYELLASENIKDAQARESHLDYVNSLKSGGVGAVPPQQEEKKDEWKNAYDSDELERPFTARRRSNKTNDSFQKPRKLYVLIIVAVAIIFIYFLLPVLWPLLLSMGLGYVGIRFRDRKAVGFALLLGIYGIGSLSFTSPTSMNQTSSLQPEQQPVVQSSTLMPVKQVNDDAKVREMLTELEKEARELEAKTGDASESNSQQEVIVVNLEQKETSEETEDQIVTVVVDEELDFIYIGMRQDQVQRILGEPEKIEVRGNYNQWSYGISHVTFDENDKVAGWHNFGNRLANGMRQPVAGSPPFDIGSGREDVLRAVGSAEKIEGRNPNLWNYGIAWVSFDDNGHVTGWHNFGNRLANGMRQPVAGSPPFDIGSGREDVLRAVGSAEKIEGRNPNLWNYGIAWVSFDDNGQVSGWNNFGERFGDMVLE